MSLTSLRSLASAATLANSAFDTARTTLKAMAEAAVAPAGDETTAAAGQGDSAPKAPTSTLDRMDTSAQAEPAGEKPKHIRKGVALDAYA